MSESEDDDDDDEVEAEEEQDEDSFITATEFKPRTPRLGKPILNSDSEGSADEVEDEDAGGWGNSRRDYYNADINETEQDALDEEAEARRLQRKQLEGMTEADFGFDEAEWLEAEEEEAEEAGTKGHVVTRIQPRIHITSETTAEERMDILKTRYPEFEPLAREFVELQERYEELKKSCESNGAAQINQESNGNDVEQHMPINGLKYRTLAAYLAALTMYFFLLTSTARDDKDTPTCMPPEAIQDHSIMSTLIECRDLWARVKDLSEPKDTDVTVNGHSNGVKPRLEENVSMITEEEPREPIVSSKKPKAKKSRAQKSLEAQIAEAEAQRRIRLEEAEASLADLSNLTASTKNDKATRRPPKEADESGSDIGEPTMLTAAELADKARQKKSLRFYTSQIAQKSNKRTAAGRDAGGDDDLPYREKWRERQARLQAEAEKRGKKMALPGQDLGEGSDSGEEISNAARKRQAAGHDIGDDENYYDFIAAQSQKKKADKAARAPEASAGGVQRIVDGEVGEDGKRAISYAIEKNKGLTPKRKKDVRNPRVKKRNKFEAKKKKLGSIKPVWKGGEGRGGYGGELTGIKSGLIKGVRL